VEGIANLKDLRRCYNEHGIFKHPIENQMMNEGFKA
jgi:hypothetical protein